MAATMHRAVEIYPAHSPFELHADKVRQATLANGCFY